jgi:protein-S-isoprenylcysteine O-methyltransferase Ste14
VTWGQFAPNLPVQVSGLAMIVASFIVLVPARRTLGDNWAHAVEYQIKPGQELVTSGIYRYVRHPIYSGLALGIIGVELVAHSYLVFLFIPALALASYLQAQREEELLIKQFGSKYRDYMKHSAMFIPLLW